LSDIFENLIKKDELEYDDKYYDLCEFVLTKPYESQPIISSMPKHIIQLADKMWSQIDDYDNIGSRYHLSSLSNSKYFPASAFQTPVYMLLLIAQKETIDFILKFTNKSIQYYYKNFSKHDPAIKEVNVYYNDNDAVKQYISRSIWNIHRENSSFAIELLQSMHMALEKRLLELSKSRTLEEMKALLQYLIKNSVSVSITAVASSIILSNPDDYFDIAKNLFKTIEIVYYKDYERAKTLEPEISKISSMFSGLLPKNEIFEDEREEAKKSLIEVSL